jgi:hypothetical protein
MEKNELRGALIFGVVLAVGLFLVKVLSKCVG